MKTITEKVSNGNFIKYKEINGTCYHEQTPDEIVQILEQSRINRERLRFFFGDVKTGRSWAEENDTIGRIGRSTGSIKIPLLIKTSRSFGGGGLLDHCIVKIVRISDNKILYIHDSFYQPIFDVDGLKVFQDGEVYANCNNEQSALRLAAFMNGLRHSK